MGLVDFKNVAIAYERKSNQDLRKMTWLFKMMSNKNFVVLGSQLTLLAFKLRLPIKGVVKQTIFQQFCGGTTFKECQKTINELEAYNVGTILDYGAEGKKNDAAFDLTVTETIKALEFAATNTAVPVVSCKVTGLTYFELLEKITAAKTLTEKEVRQYNQALNRLDTICKRASELKVGLFIDAEESWIQGAIDSFTDEMMLRYNKERVIVYNTFQMYRHDRLAFLKISHKKSTENGYLLGAKLVRGAYMEKERARAEELNYPSPIQPNKKSCDEDYNAAVAFCVENYKSIASCVASHNEYSTQYQLELMDKIGVDRKHPHFNFCQLYGMSDNLTFNLAKEGYNVAKYVPYGPVRDVIPYLIRRAQENSAVDGEVSRELNMIKKELLRRKK